MSHTTGYAPSDIHHIGVDGRRDGTTAPTVSGRHPRDRPASFLERKCREAMLRRLGELRSGQLTIVDGDGAIELGSTGQNNSMATIKVHDPRFSGGTGLARIIHQPKTCASG